jgi:hypothetical protein
MKIKCSLAKTVQNQGFIVIMGGYNTACTMYPYLPKKSTYKIHRRTQTHTHTHIHTHTHTHTHTQTHKNTHQHDETGDSRYIFSPL